MIDLINFFTELERRNQKVNYIPVYSDDKKAWSRWYRDKYLRSEHWKNVREKTLERDNHKCVICDSVNSLQVHHLKYSGYLYNELENPDCVITLCSECHKKQHK